MLGLGLGLRVLRLVFVCSSMPSSGSGLRIDTISLPLSVSLCTHVTFCMALGNAVCVGYGILFCPGFVFLVVF